MRVGSGEITYCQICGENLHYDCMKKWETQQNPDADSDTEATCTLCRADWASTPDNRPLPCPVLNPESFSVYFEWLYTHKISLGEYGEKEAVSIYKTLITTWAFGRMIGDQKFLKAIFQSFLNVTEDTHLLLGPANLKLLYADATVGCAHKKFVVQVYARRAEKHWFRERRYPVAFMKDLSDALFERRGERRSFDDDLKAMRAIVDGASEL